MVGVLPPRKRRIRRQGPRDQTLSRSVPGRSALQNCRAVQRRTELAARAAIVIEQTENLAAPRRETGPDGDRDP